MASFGLIFLAQSKIETFTGAVALDLILVAVGSVILFLTLQRIPRINRLTRWVNEVKE